MNLTHVRGISNLFSSPLKIRVPSLRLRNGSLMPQFALGTWKSTPGATQVAVETAIQAGYRNIDCANDYNNEPEVGLAIENMIKQGIVTRDELFIQIKLWNTNHRIEHIREDLNASLTDLKLDYVDSYAIHWPQASPSTGKSATTRINGAFPAHHSKDSMFPIDDAGYFCTDNSSHFLETYQFMQQFIDEQLVLNLGLSNFNKKQIQEVLTNTTDEKYKPALLQNECHPYLQQKDLIDYCRINNIQFQAFSSLGSGDTHLAVSESPTGVIPLKDKLVLHLAEMHNKDAAQVILKWHSQRGYSFVSKSINPTRILSNMNGVFGDGASSSMSDHETWCLTEEEMRLFDDINYGWRHLYWRETANHADYPFFDELPSGYQLEKPTLESSSGTTA